MYYTKEYGYVTRAEHIALVQAEHTYQKLHQQNKHTKYSRMLPLLRLKGEQYHGKD